MGYKEQLKEIHYMMYMKIIALIISSMLFTSCSTTTQPKLDMTAFP